MQLKPTVADLRQLVIVGRFSSYPLYSFVRILNRSRDHIIIGMLIQKHGVFYLNPLYNLQVILLIKITSIVFKNSVIVLKNTV